MICLMHQGEPYGHLGTFTGALPLKYIAQRCNVTAKELSKAIAELDSKQIFSRTDAGVIFSRRMVQDEANRLIRGQGGAKSQWNPNVPRRKDTFKDTLHSTTKNDSKGILSMENPVPSFGPEEEEVKEKDKERNTKNFLTENCFDPIPGWKWFAAEYPAHRLNPEMDCRLWISVVESYETERVLREKLPRFKASEQWQKNGGKFVPSAENFLSKRMFSMQPGPPTPELERPLTHEEYCKGMGWLEK